MQPISTMTPSLAIVTIFSGLPDHLVDGGVVPVEEVQVVHIELRHGDDNEDGDYYRRL